MEQRSPSGNRTAVDRSSMLPGRLTRYDFVLAVIPAAFLVAVIVGTVAAVPTRLAVIGASVFGALAVLDALFLNPPRGRSPRTRRRPAG